MAIKVFVVDDAKCLHDLLDVLGEQTVVAPTNHASTNDQYGKGTTTSYGHLMITAESGTVGGHWNDSSTYTGKAVSGADGKDFDTRIKQNANDIADIQGKYQCPVGGVMMSDTDATAAAWASAIGYGTWELVGDGSVSGHSIYYFRRSE